MKNKKALLIINLGTPDLPEKKQVRKYLREFLNDPRVIDLPFLLRKILVNLIIIPFRTSKSTALYKKLWTKNGSPLLIHLKNLQKKVSAKISSDYQVFIAMRYGKPNLEKTLDNIYSHNFEELVVFPLFPQYASSTTGSVFEFILNYAKKREIFPNLNFISQYYNRPEFIKVFSEKIKKYQPEKYDKVIFSYHGLPLRQVQKTHPNFEVSKCECQTSLPEHGKFCYKATCYETTRLLQKATGISAEKSVTAFQSRLSEGWLSPFADEVLANLAKNGIKSVLVVAPSFTADCLETIVEIEHEYKQIFLENGGKKLTLVKSLNSSDDWADAICKIIKE